MNIRNVLCVTTLSFISFGSLQAQDLMQDTWVATDGLGRLMPTSDDVGSIKTDKKRTVGIFYVTWHTMNLENAPAVGDVSKILKNNPQARKDGTLWPQGIGMYHWGEPEYGYFLSQDPYVIRHDISMLADAGVDVLILDVTNAVRYWDEWSVLFKVMEQMKSEGNPVPKFCFWAYNGEVITVVQDIYEKYYQNNLYKDMWFYWEGKPLLLCNMYPDLDANGGGIKHHNLHYEEDAVTNRQNPHYGNPYYTEKYYSDYTQEVKDFFTMRNLWWGYYKWGGKRYVGTEDNWSFGYAMEDKRVSSLTPLLRASTHKGNIEQMAVTPAEHPVSLTGKSWRVNTLQPDLNDEDVPDSAYVPWLGRIVSNPQTYGIYFQDRWDEALEVDPPFIYLNDWNEWTAGKYPIGKAPGSEAPGPKSFLGRHDNTFYFVDQYNSEFNRTISPAKGEMGDNYYMQMVQNIRRYKGVRPVPVNKGFTKIIIDGDFSEWNKVGVSYYDTREDTVHRDFPGYAHLRYVDNSGRNDIVLSKVAADKKNVYFYAQTSGRLSPSSDKNWMLLLIDADKNSHTGWYGYDYIVNYHVIDQNTTCLMKYTSGRWQIIGELRYNCKGSQLEIRVPKSLLGFKAGSRRFTFDFKWTDNPLDLKNPISLCTHGDTAPNRRFNYRCAWEK